MLKKIFVIFCGASILLSAQKAKADFFHGFELQAGTDFPLAIGARAQFNFANDFYAIGVLGYSPEFLTSIMGTMMSTLGFAGESTARVMTTSIANSMLIEARLGYRINGESGLYIEGGYAMLSGAGGGEVSTEDGNAAMGTNYNVANNNVTSISSDIGGLTVHSGYTWKMSDKMYIMADVGFIMPISATTSVSATQSSGQTAQFASELQSYIEGEWTNATFLPMASVYMSYLF